MSIEVRAAVAADQAAIRTLVRSERLNPFGLDWPNFVVAVEAGRLIGTAQLRPHRPRLAELGSVAVATERRGQGLAARLIEAALARADGRVLAITAAAQAERWRRWGFRPVGFGSAPWPVRLNYALGQTASGLAFVRGLPPRRLAILERFAGTGDRGGGSPSPRIVRRRRPA